MATKRAVKQDGVTDETVDRAEAAAVAEARAEVDRGKTVPYDRVRRWLLSWGSKKELPRPRCK